MGFHGGLLFRVCNWLEVVAAESTIISPSRTDRIKAFPATAVQHSASSARPAPIPDCAEAIGAAGQVASVASATPLSNTRRGLDLRSGPIGEMAGFR